MKNKNTILLTKEDQTTINFLADKWDVSPEIHPEDFIFHFLYNNPNFASKDDAIKYYFNDGQKSAQQLLQMLTDVCNYDDRQKVNILEFASGYGCVTRHMKNVIPFAQITTCDIHPDAQVFIKEKLHVNAILSTSQPEKLNTAENFDVIFALSFFSHMPKATFGRWLKRLLSMVKPGGHVIFTTHGLASRRWLPNVNFDTSGFWFRPSSEQKDLDTSEYGLTCTLPKYVLSQLFENTQSRLLFYREAYWWEHQDVYVAQRDESATTTKTDLQDQIMKNNLFKKARTKVKDILKKKTEVLHLRHNNKFLQNKGYCYSCNQHVQFTVKNNWLRDFYLCDNCGSIPRERATMYCVDKFFPDWREKIIHESSPVPRGTSIRLKNEAKNYLGTQYFPDVKNGVMYEGFRNENLEELTFDDETIDLHITQDVFEHVLDPAQAFREIARTLKPGGAHIFTTPLVNKNSPTERCAKRNPDGTILHLIDPPEYHGNPVSADGSLVTVHWGYDITKYIYDACGLFTEMVYIDSLELGIKAEYIEVLITRK